MSSQLESDKETLRSRLARRKLDLEARIAAHPLSALGVALGLGAVLALLGRRRGHGPEDRTVRGMLSGAAGALVLRIARDVALGRASSAAQQWWAERGGTERAASRDPSVEPFLEH